MEREKLQEDFFADAQNFEDVKTILEAQLSPEDAKMYIQMVATVERLVNGGLKDGRAFEIDYDTLTPITGLKEVVERIVNASR